MNRLLIMAVVSLGLPMAALGAQASPDSVRLRNDCRLAAQVLRTGEPGPKARWAWDMIYSCPEAGVASAAGLRQLRHDSDTAHFSPVLRVGFAVLDGELFTAALDVAADRSATPTAREASFFVLVDQLTADWNADFSSISGPDPETGCRLGLVNDRGVPVTLTPLPADAAARADAMARTVAANAAEPAPVRVAAECIRQVVRDSLVRQP